VCLWLSHISSPLSSRANYRERHCSRMPAHVLLICAIHQKKKSIYKTPRLLRHVTFAETCVRNALAEKVCTKVCIHIILILNRSLLDKVWKSDLYVRQVKISKIIALVVLTVFNKPIKFQKMLFKNRLLYALDCLNIWFLMMCTYIPLSCQSYELWKSSSICSLMYNLLVLFSSKALVIGILFPELFLSCVLAFQRHHLQNQILNPAL